MRILLTGGSGFIGRNLVDYLRRSHEVVAPSRAELDVADPIALDRWFSEHDVDAVVMERSAGTGTRATTGQLWTNLRISLV
jgi:nucleoside-diphosphate-sugar epimerase